MQARLLARFNLTSSVMPDPHAEALLRSQTWQPPHPTTPDWISQPPAAASLPLVVRQTADGRGFGAFAARDLTALEPIGEYAGEVVHGCASLHPLSPSSLGRARQMDG